LPVPLKGNAKADLADVRRAIISEHVDRAQTAVAEFNMPVRDVADPDYRGGVERWHDAIALAWRRQIEAHLVRVCAPDVLKVALLVWGDPSLYDSTLRIAERLRLVMDVHVRIIPGLTSIQMLTAAHAIPLNEIGESVLIITGRQLRERGWPDGADTVVVMLDGETSFRHVAPDGVSIWWGAYLGLEQQLIVEGPLSSVGERIVGMRAEARRTHGWIMDIYLLRRSPRHA
jgi:precorrin-6A synthase